MPKQACGTEGHSNNMFLLPAFISILLQVPKKKKKKKEMYRTLVYTAWMLAVAWL